MTASLSMSPPLTAGHYGHAFVSDLDDFSEMESRHYVLSTVADEHDRFHLGGAGGLVLESGQSCYHVFFSDFGTPGEVVQIPADTRLYLERLV
jgi:hypothetical protein